MLKSICNCITCVCHFLLTYLLTYLLNYLLTRPLLHCVCIQLVDIIFAKISVTVTVSFSAFSPP